MSYGSRNKLETIQSQEWMVNQIKLTRAIRPPNDSVAYVIKAANETSAYQLQLQVQRQEQEQLQRRQQQRAPTPPSPTATPSGGSKRKGGEVNSLKVEGVLRFACLPFPTGDKAAFLNDAISFSDWVGFAPDDPSETAPTFFKRMFMCAMMALQQKDLGTEGYEKRGLLSKDRWSQFDAWRYLPRSNRKPNQDAYVDSYYAESGSFCFDLDVYEKLKWLKDYTMNLEKDQEPDHPWTSNPSSKSNGSPNLRDKWRVFLQPTRKKSDPKKFGGFLMWILVLDPNWSADVGRRKFLNTVAKYGQSIANKKFPEKDAQNTLSRHLVTALKELLFEDPGLAEYTQESWVHDCMHYSNLALALEQKKHDERRREREARQQRTSSTSSSPQRPERRQRSQRDDPRSEGGEEQQGEAQDDVPDATDELIQETRRTLGLADAGAESDDSEDTRADEREPVQLLGGGEAYREELEAKYENPWNLKQTLHDYKHGYSGKETQFDLCKVFTHVKALALASEFDMDVDHVESKGTFSYEPSALDTSGKVSMMNVTFSPKHLDRRSNRNSGDDDDDDEDVGEDDVFHLYDPNDGLDDIYEMDQEWFFWSNSSTGQGLRYSYFPWSGGEKSPFNRMAQIPPFLCRNPNPDKQKLEEMKARRKRRRDRTLANSTAPDSSPASSSLPVTAGIRAPARLMSSASQRAAAAGLGVDVASLKFGGVPIVSSCKGDGGDNFAFLRRKKALQISPSASKDCVTLLGEIFKVWRTSFVEYDKLAIKHIDKPKKLEVQTVQMNRAMRRSVTTKYLLPNDYMMYYYREKADLRRTAASHLFRAMKHGGTRNVMTVPFAYVSQYIMYNLYNRDVRTDEGLADLYVHQEDYATSHFASYAQRLAHRIRHDHTLVNLWKDGVVILLGSHDCFRHVEGFHFNWMGSGEKGGGKSLLLETMRDLLIKGTVVEYMDSSPKNNFVDLSSADKCTITDELPPYACEGAGKNGYTTDPVMNMQKSALTKGKMTYMYMAFLDIGDGSRDARMSYSCETPCWGSLFCVSNLMNHLDKAWSDRFLCTPVADPIKAMRATQRAHTRLHGRKVAQLPAPAPPSSAQDQSPQIPEVEGSNAAAEKARRALEKKLEEAASKTVNILEVVLTPPAPDAAAILEKEKNSFSSRQALHAWIEKQIHVGALPDVDVDLACYLLRKVVNSVAKRENGFLKMETRMTNVVKFLTRSVVKEDAINQLYFCEGRDYNQINEETMVGVAPYLVCQFHHAVFVITLLTDNIVHTTINTVLTDSVNGLCKAFDRASFLTNRKDVGAFVTWYVSKEPLRLLLDPSRADGVALQSELRQIRSDQKIHQTEVLRQLFIELAGKRKQQRLLGKKREAAASVFCMRIATQVEEEQQQDANLPANASNNNDDASGVRGKAVQVWDLNYIAIFGKDYETLKRDVQERLSIAYSLEDIDQAIKTLTRSKINVRWSFKPMTLEELLAGGDSLLYEEEDFEYPVLEICYEAPTVQNAGTGRSPTGHGNAGGGAGNRGGGGGGQKIHSAERRCCWKICVHALNEHGKGESLIIDAIRDAIAYEGFRPRKALTGFPVSSQVGMFKYETFGHPLPSSSSAVQPSGALRESSGGEDADMLPQGIDTTATQQQQQHNFRLRSMGYQSQDTRVRLRYNDTLRQSVLKKEALRQKRRKIAEGRASVSSASGAEARAQAEQDEDGGDDCNDSAHEGEDGEENESPEYRELVGEGEGDLRVRRFHRRFEEDLDPYYTEQYIDFKNQDVDDWAVERFFRKNALPLMKLCDQSPGEQQQREQLRWIFTNEDGKQELRPLPTEYNQRLRNYAYATKPLRDSSFDESMRDAHADYASAQQDDRGRWSGSKEEVDDFTLRYAGKEVLDELSLSTSAPRRDLFVAAGGY